MWPGDSWAQLVGALPTPPPPRIVPAIRWHTAAAR